MDLIEQLNTAMDQTEQIARQAALANPGAAAVEWSAEKIDYRDSNGLWGKAWAVRPERVDGIVLAVCPAEILPKVSAHIAHFDPKRVLDKVAADREILELYTGTVAIKDAVEEKKRLGDEPTRQEWNDWARCQHELAALRVVVEILAKGYGIDTSGSAQIAATMEQEGLPY